MKCNIYMFVAILENGRHLGFSIGKSCRMDLITIEMSHAKFGDCITICTIHPKNNTICSTVGLSVTTYPKANITTRPNVIALTKFVPLVIVEKCGVPYILPVIYRVLYIHSHEYVYIHHIIFNYRSKKA